MLPINQKLRYVETQLDHLVQYEQIPDTFQARSSLGLSKLVVLRLNDDELIV